MNQDTIGVTFSKGAGMIMATGLAVTGKAFEAVSPFIGTMTVAIGMLGSSAFFISLCFDIERKWRRRKLEIKGNKIIGDNEK